MISGSVQEPACRDCLDARLELLVEGVALQVVTMPTCSSCGKPLVESTSRVTAGRKRSTCSPSCRKRLNRMTLPKFPHPPKTCGECGAPCTLPGEAPNGQIGGVCTSCGWDFLLELEPPQLRGCPNVF